MLFQSKKTVKEHSDFSLNATYLAFSTMFPFKAAQKVMKCEKFMQHLDFRHGSWLQVYVLNGWKILVLFKLNEPKVDHHFKASILRAAMHSC